MRTGPRRGRRRRPSGAPPTPADRVATRWTRSPPTTSPRSRPTTRARTRSAGRTPGSSAGTRAGSSIRGRTSSRTERGSSPTPATAAASAGSRSRTTTPTTPTETRRSKRRPESHPSAPPATPPTSRSRTATRSARSPSSRRPATRPTTSRSSPAARASRATRCSARAASSSPPTPARSAATCARSRDSAPWTWLCSAPATARSCSTPTPSSTSTSRIASTASASSSARSPTACGRPTSCSTGSGPTRPPPCAARRRSRWRPTSTSSPRRAACPTAWNARSSPATARSDAGSAVDRRHVRVAVAGRRPDGRDLLEPGEVVVGQLDVGRRDVLLEISHLLRARDRDDVVAAAQHPCERELAGRAPLLLGDAPHALDEVEVALEVLALEARVVAAEVVLVEVGRAREAAGEEAAPERAVGDEADAELADRRQDLVLGVARPQRVLALQRGDRVHGVGAADRLRRGLGEPEVAHLALRDELGHRPDGLLDRHAPVDAVLVVEVDVLDAEALQRGVAGAAHVLRAAVDAQALAVLAAYVAELRRDHDAVAAVGDRAADELLVRERAVHVGGVGGVDAELERAVDRPDRLVLVAPAVELRHAHAAEAHRADLEPLSERSSLHASQSSRSRVIRSGVPAAQRLQSSEFAPSGGARAHRRRHTRWRTRTGCLRSRSWGSRSTWCRAAPRPAASAACSRSRGARAGSSRRGTCTRRRPSASSRCRARCG